MIQQSRRLVLAAIPIISPWCLIFEAHSSNSLLHAELGFLECPHRLSVPHRDRSQRAARRSPARCTSRVPFVLRCRSTAWSQGRTAPTPFETAPCSSRNRALPGITRSGHLPAAGSLSISTRVRRVGRARSGPLRRASRARAHPAPRRAMLSSQTSSVAPPRPAQSTFRISTLHSAAACAAPQTCRGDASLEVLVCARFGGLQRERKARHQDGSCSWYYTPSFAKPVRQRTVRNAPVPPGPLCAAGPAEGYRPS